MVDVEGGMKASNVNAILDRGRSIQSRRYRYLTINTTDDSNDFDTLPY